MSLFINVSHHSYKKWSQKQIDAATVHPITGKELRIIDLQFPAIKADFDTIDVMKIANRYVNRILSIIEQETGKSYQMDGSVVIHCVGEYGLCFQLVLRLKEHNFIIVHSCTERKVNKDNGGHASFEFIRFRSYF